MMQDHNIGCRPFFFPLSSLPAYQNHKQVKTAKDRNKTSYKISPYGINLPCGLNITEEKVEYVCQKLIEIINRSS